MKKEYKKGDLIRFNCYSMSHSVYMIVGKLEDDRYYLIRIKRKDRRFDIKRTINMTLHFKLDYINLVDIENLNLDKRDLDIFNDFHNYILNNNFKFEYKSYTYNYKIKKNKYSYTDYTNIVVYNLNLSKYKKYSNKV